MGERELVTGTPLRIGRLTLRNRFVSAPMERNYCDADGTMTGRYIDYLARRAKGGAALVFTEASYVRADGKGRMRQMGVDVDERVPAIAKAVEAVHREGALFGVQLNHGGRTAQGKVSGYTPVAPSAIPCEVVGGEMPQVLDAEDIDDLVNSYAAAASRCVQAGVDAVTLHGGHGYLIHQFLSPAYNLRDDEFADPVRFVNLVIAAVREAVPDVTLGLRLSAFEGVPAGLDAEATLARIRLVRTDLLDYLDVSAGNYEAGQWIIQPGEWQRGLLAPFAQPYREFGMPVGVAGRISTPEVAEAIVSSGQADFVSLARTLHADPDFPVHALDGGRYRPCIACNYCIDNLGSGEPIPCTVNPWVGREADEPAAASDRAVTVTVVGAGPAGLAVARELARGGAEVEVFESRPYVGGDFALAARLRGYPEYGRIIDWYAAELAERGVAVNLGVTVTPDMLASWTQADAVVLATGARGYPPDLPEGGAREVVELHDWLGAERAAPAQAVVYGADRDGAAVADDLAAHATHVTLVGPQPTIAPDVGRRAKIALVPRLLEHPHVRTFLDARIVGVESDRLRVRGPGGQEGIHAPGPVIVSMGVQPRRDLDASASELNPRLGVFSVGDASGDGGSVHMALTTAAAVAREILAHPHESSSP